MNWGRIRKIELKMLKINTEIDKSDSELEDFRRKVAGTNINEQTLPATDYLNHFNEIVMTLDMVPDFPELLEEAREWQPKSYPDHFLSSTIADKDLAAEAYGYVPERYRVPFDLTVDHLNRLILLAIDRLGKSIADGNEEHLRDIAEEQSANIRRLLDIASANIHGSKVAMDQAEIDNLLSD